MTLPQNRLLGASAIFDPSTKTAEVDVGNILRRLLLFDTYILRSHRFLEFPELVSCLGFDGTLALVRSGALRVFLEPSTIGQLGQDGSQIRGSRPPLPLGFYSFNFVIPHNRRDYVSNCFQESIDPIPVSIKQRIKLKRSILDVLERVPEGIPKLVFDQLRADFRQLNPSLAIAVQSDLKRRSNLDVPVDEINVAIHEIGDGDFRSESNLESRFGLSAEICHRVVERAALDLAGLNQRLAEMKTLGAISGFRHNDLDVFSAKVEFLVRTLDPDNQDARARRLFETLELPDFRDVAHGRKLDVERFLEVRASDECREFRSWLSTIDGLKDEEIKARFSSLRDRIAASLHTSTGKGLRFLASAGLGLIPGAGIVVDALDSFVLDRLLPRSGIVSFVGKLYPSIFPG